MRGRVELGGHMALGADRVAGRAQLEGMRLVTVAAGYALLEHPALQKRAVVVHLVALLSVRPIEPVVEQREPEAVCERSTVHDVIRELPAARMAARAGLDLAHALPRRTARRTARLRVDLPRGAAPLVKQLGQPLARPAETPPVAPLLRPRDVIRTGSVARLARHVDLRPLRIEVLGVGAVVLPEIRRVAIGTLVVPVLVDAGPVLRVARLELAIGIEMEPALAALLLRARVPRHAERLQATARQLDQILLQRRQAERVLDLEVGELAVGTVGVDVVLPVAAEEGRSDTGVPELRIIEIAENRLLIGDLHREVVMRTLPGFVLGSVTRGACLSTDVARRHKRRCRRGLRRIVRGVRLRIAGEQESDRRDDQRTNRRDSDPACSGLRATDGIAGR